jgi:hypothetical protein
VWNAFLNFADSKYRSELQVLISRLYRTDFKYAVRLLRRVYSDSSLFTRRSIADVFRIQVVSNSDVRSPIITLGSTSFFHVRINNLYVVAVTKYFSWLQSMISADFQTHAEVTRTPRWSSSSVIDLSIFPNLTLERLTRSR